MMEYFNYKKAKKHTDTAEKSEHPILTDEDEAFLHRITSEGEEVPPPLPDRPQDLAVAGNTKGNDAQLALMDGAQNIPIPDVPDTPDDVMPAIEGERDIGKGKEKAKDGKKPFKWDFLRRDSRDSKRQNQVLAATDLQAVAEGLKAADAKPNEDGVVSDHEAKKEEEEMTVVLEQLNLAAINNRVFSISKESQALLKKFTLVLKDLVNGVPTAYDDLESLLTNSENQLQDSYKHLPSFLQKLIEQLPSKFTSSMGPEILAAAAERHGVKHEYASGAANIASKMGLKARIPSLKDLVTKPGAVAGMLRTIMNFLKLRFPAFMGMNVLWSLALFLLLFVFWYCHKRGKETRLEKERLLNEAEIAQLEKEVIADAPSPTTTAPEGAPIEAVREGMRTNPQSSIEESEATTTEGEAPYAPGGSLAKELEKEKEAEKSGEKAEITVREVDAGSVLAGPSSRTADKEERRRRRFEGAVSKQPLDSQESCIVS